MFTQQLGWSPTAKRLLLGILGVSALAQLAGAIAVGRDGGSSLLVVGPVLVVLVLLGFLFRQFGTLKVELDRSALTVGFGLFRRREPLERIVGFRPVKYSPWHWGGYGIRLRFRQTLYNVPGDHGSAVELSLQGGKKLLFSSLDPEAVCAALGKAKAG